MFDRSHGVVVIRSDKHLCCLSVGRIRRDVASRDGGAAIQTHPSTFLGAFVDISWGFFAGSYLGAHRRTSALTCFELYTSYYAL